MENKGNTGNTETYGNIWKNTDVTGIVRMCMELLGTWGGTRMLKKMKVREYVHYRERRGPFRIVAEHSMTIRKDVGRTGEIRNDPELIGYPGTMHNDREGLCGI